MFSIGSFMKYWPDKVDNVTKYTFWLFLGNLYQDAEAIPKCSRNQSQAKISMESKETVLWQ